MNSSALSLCVFPLVFSAGDLPKAYGGESRTGGQKALHHRTPICDRVMARAGGTSRPHRPQPQEKLRVVECAERFEFRASPRRVVALAGPKVFPNSLWDWLACSRRD